MKKEKKLDIFYIIIIFVISAIFYMFFSQNVGMPTFINSDESVWINLARSFHYDQGFQYKYIYQSFDSTLYSIIISLAYFFFEPNKILNIFRGIGTLIMCSSVIPAYLFAKFTLNSKKWSIIISVFAIIIPEMFYTLFATQEVLSYPLLLWLFYLLYKKYNCNSLSNFFYYRLGALFFMVYWSKTYTVIFIISYVLLELVYLMFEKNNRKESAQNLFRVITAFLILVIINKIGIYAMNNFNQGYTHYNNQLSRIPEINIEFIYNIIKGSVIYALGILFSFGILPLCAVFASVFYKRANKFNQLLVVSTFALIGQVVLSIYLIENKEEWTQYRIHIRYFFPLFIPYVICMVSVFKKEIFIKSRLILTSILCIVGTLFSIFFIDLNNFTGQSQIDAMLIKVTRHAQQMFGDFSKILLFFLLALIIVIILLLWINKLKVITPIWFLFCMISFIIIVPVNFKISTSANSDLDKSFYEKELTTISESIKNFDYVVFVKGNNKAEDNIEVYFGDYIDLYSKVPVRTIYLEDLYTFSIEQENTCLIISNNLGVEVLNGINVPSNSKTIKLYSVKPGSIMVGESIYRKIEFRNRYCRDISINEDNIEMEKGGELWGPYWRFAKGIYKVIISGYSLDHLNYEIYYHEDNQINYLDAFIVEKNDSKIVIQIDVKSEIKDLELHLANSGEKNRINNIEFILVE